MLKLRPQIVATAVIICCAVSRPAPGQSAPSSRPAGRFLEAKTFFQTNVAYDPRLAIAVDAVVLHRHGERPPRLTGTLESWTRRGVAAGRMFFADSDAGGSYWKGRWDGREHADEVERRADGAVVMCAGVRPYMLPTEGWTRHLQEMTVHSIEAGAEAVLPEEPLAHLHTGYEAAFKAIWETRYGRPWQPEATSPEALFLTGQLKTELHLELERTLARTAKAHAASLGREVAVCLPVHSIYSNIAAKLVAPMGLAVGEPDIDAYVGQVWTGPVNWCLAHYSSPDKTFFLSAYALYDYFDALAAGSGKKLWMLVDPVEDDPNHTWAEFEQWYRHCLVAMLLFPRVNAYEVMPWPDRIFLPGQDTGGGTPAPESYRIALLSTIQALQDMPLGGQWRQPDDGRSPTGATAGIGVAVADSALWESEPQGTLDGLYGLLLPLVRIGVPATACLLERSTQAGYLSDFRVIALSCERLKPVDPAVNEALAGWVRRGGSLLVFGAADGLRDELFWWTRAGHESPLHHLMGLLRVPVEQEGWSKAGQGWVFRRAESPRVFADPSVARDVYLPLVDEAAARAGIRGGLAPMGAFCLRRGPYLIAHASSRPVQVTAALIDLFDPELAVQQDARLPVGASGLFRDVSEAMNASGGPAVLHCTHRLIRQEHDAASSRLVRLFTAGREPAGLTAVDAAGTRLVVDARVEGQTLRLRFDNQPDGATIEIRWR